MKLLPARDKAVNPESWKLVVNRVAYAQVMYACMHVRMYVCMETGDCFNRMAYVQIIDVLRVGFGTLVTDMVAYAHR